MIKYLLSESNLVVEYRETGCNRGCSFWFKLQLYLKNNGAPKCTVCRFWKYFMEIPFVPSKSQAAFLSREGV